MAQAIEIRFSTPPQADVGKKKYMKPRIVRSVKARVLKWDAQAKMLDTVYSKVGKRGGGLAVGKALMGVRNAVSSDPECGNFVAKGLIRPSTLDVIGRAMELGGEHASLLTVTTIIEMLNKDWARGTSRVKQFVNYLRNTPEVHSALGLAAQLGDNAHPVRYLALRLPGKLEPRSIVEALSAFEETYDEHGAEAAVEVAFEACRINAIRGSPGLKTPDEIMNEISSMRMKTLAGKPVRNEHGVLEWLPTD